MSLHSAETVEVEAFVHTDAYECQLVLRLNSEN